MRSQEIDIELLKTSLIVEVVHLRYVAGIVVVVLHLQVGIPVFVGPLQHFNGIGCEHMGVLGKLGLLEFCVGIN